MSLGTLCSLKSWIGAGFWMVCVRLGFFDLENSLLWIFGGGWGLAIGLGAFVDSG